jgi:hypothetical protein
MPISLARSINSASDMRAHTHAFLNSSQAFIAHASLRMRATTLFLLVWADIGSAGALFLENSAAMRMPLIFSDSRCLRSRPERIRSHGLRHVNNDSNLPRSQGAPGSRRFDWSAAAHWELEELHSSTIATRLLSPQTGSLSGVQVGNQSKVLPTAARTSNPADDFSRILRL